MASHFGGQILLVTGGCGWYQEKDGPLRSLHPGDVIQMMSGTSF
ncbi:cupin domain-containing protein [Secundilactobacillus paracollinoides]|nr:hypothetical protein [Secundilactobacillus paracollinoides]